MSRSNLKTMAKSQLKGNWGWALLVSLLGCIFASIFSSFSIGILGGMLLFGVSYSYLALVDGNKQSNVFTAIFSAFTNKRFIPTLLTSLLSEIFISLWLLLLIVPGIVKAYAYAMAPYITKDLADAGQEITATQAISESRKVMDGHKGELFVLDLSFIGWWLLSILTLGIGFLWLIPYVRVTHANFYRQLVGDTYKKAGQN